MSALKLIMPAIFLLLLSTNSKAATGCFVGSTLYIRDTGTTIFLSTIPVYDSPYTTNPLSCPRAQLLSTTTNQCALNFLSRGVLVDYVILNPPVDCPLDHYLLLLIIPFSGFAFYLLRRTAVYY